MNITDQLKQYAAEHPYPLVFATISGAHLYGFASPDSDYDLRGVHLLPVREVLGLSPAEETVERSHDPGGPDDLELDLVTHDLEKFMRLMLKRNGYVLEQLYSPLIVQTTSAHERLKELGRGCITRHHVHHYLGFAANQWKLFVKEQPPRIKPLLYVYRVLLTGIHLMRTGEVEAHLPTLNERFELPYIDELIARKAESTEQARLGEGDLDFHRREFGRLEAMLQDAGGQSDLADAPTTRAELNDLLVQVRLKGV